MSDNGGTKRSPEEAQKEESLEALICCSGNLMVPIAPGN
jgi:hypothetical protein